MSFLKELSRKNPKFAPIVSTLVCVGIGWERVRSFAEAQQTNPPANGESKTESEKGETNAQGVPSDKLDLPLPAATAAAPMFIETDKTSVDDKKSKNARLMQRVPLEQRAIQKFESIKTKQEACALLEGKVLSYYDAASLIVKCVQRPIEDPDLLNILVYKQKKAVTEVPAHIYRLIPFGEPWAAPQNQAMTGSKVCRELNGQYVTSTGTDYFFIEACKKRPFSSYVELQAHNRRNAPVLSVSPEQLEKLGEGKTTDGNYEKEVGALYKMVGDSALSTLGSADGRSKPVRSAEDIEALPLISGKEKIDGKKLCIQFSNKVVSFYSQLFFISNCKKRPLKELPISIQLRFSERGASIIDVTSAQLDSIPTGKELTEDEALTLIK